MRQSIALLTLSGAVAFAQTSLTKIWLPDVSDPEPYTESPDHYPSWAASIVHADPTATTYALSDPDVTEPPSLDDSDDAEPFYFTVTEGPSTLAYAEDDEDRDSSTHVAVTCSVDDKHVLQCVLKGTTISKGSTKLESSSFSDPYYLGHTMPVTITAGLEKLNGISSSSSSSGSSSTAAPSGPTSTAAGSHSTLTTVPNTGTGSAPAPTGTAAGDDSPNAAVSPIKGAQNALLAGLVAVVGAVFML